MSPCRQTPEGLRAESDGRLRSVDISTLPYPGVATDYKPFLVTMLSVADGVGIVTENLFSGRFRYVDELRRMGADIRNEGHHAVVRGVAQLSGAPVRAPDLRAGAALVLAGLVAEGETVVTEAVHVDRGYEDFAGKLTGLGRRRGPGPRADRARRGLDFPPPAALSYARSTVMTPARPFDVGALARRRPPVATGGRWPACCRPPNAAATTVGPPPPWPTAAAPRPTPSGSPAPPGPGSPPWSTGSSPSPGRSGVAQLAVLAVDPTSPFSGGAILGDRVRMQGHDLDAGVFIRSMASRGHLGGLAVAVPEAIRLFAAAGTPLVIVETVGVGQVEVEVASATDTTVVVVNPKWGDSIQANKAGLLETADIFVVNKADMPGAAQSRRDLEQMLDLSAPGGLAAAHPGNGGRHRRGRGRAVGRDRAAPDLPGGGRAAGAIAPGASRARVPSGPAGPDRDGDRSSEWSAPLRRARYAPWSNTGSIPTARPSSFWPTWARTAADQGPTDGTLGTGGRSTTGRGCSRYGARMTAGSRSAARHRRPNSSSVERRPDGVAVVRLDRPKMNALSTAMLAQVRSVFGALAEDPPGAVVLWGGQRLFAAGADVGEFSDPGAPALVAARFHAATEAISALASVTIAAITGYALGGGLELALACDLRVVADNAKLGQPEILLGIIPGGGATQRLPRLVGPARAKDLILTGRQVGADEALRIGLADRMVQADNLSRRGGGPRLGAGRREPGWRRSWPSG